MATPTIVLTVAVGLSAAEISAKPEGWEMKVIFSS
jgi:hypothetical protein